MFEEQYTRMFSEPFSLDYLDPNPVVYEKEPFSPNETIQDLTDEYLAALNILREKYLETKDDELARLLLDLLPAAIYSSLN